MLTVRSTMTTWFFVGLLGLTILLAYGSIVLLDRACVSMPQPTMQPKERSHKTEKSKQVYKEKPAGWWTKFACDIKATDFALAALTIILVGIGYWQGVQLERTVSAADRSAKATEIAAKAAKKSADTSRESFLRLEGPYFHPEFEVTVIEYGLGGQGFPKAVRFNARVKNIGRTMAILMSSHWSMNVGANQGATAGTKVPKDHERKPIIPSLVNAETLFVEETIKFDAVAWNQMAANNFLIEIIGEICGEDALGNIHTIGFGIAWNVQGNRSQWTDRKHSFYRVEDKTAQT